jgi:hypothetical protein
MILLVRMLMLVVVVGIALEMVEVDSAAEFLQLSNIPSVSSHPLVILGKTKSPAGRLRELPILS